ncbi:OTU domain-containing protein 5-B [Phalaenopsis equestris]|uniref:OTU domain-containing protein 5-B n=1 Tax=Phalaenopsis equestris TaxID=78828 RepID=UPI0009E353C1|nr:OTU domain-containing protein 5-B [Phalaenopsis equestris]XP_020577052.1 OTU domain-containing protein 5-B [Phalaenopsis equestris]XP_020577053.1 OTU domain-containing protein 5-B [Phalaenopsis equestris]
MTRIVVQRGSGSSSTNQNRPSSSSVPPPSASQSASSDKEEQEKEQNQDTRGLDDHIQHCVGIDEKVASGNEIPTETSQGSRVDVTNIEEVENRKPCIEETVESAVQVRGSGGLHLTEKVESDDSVIVGVGPSQLLIGGSNPPPPPVPPPKPSSPISGLRRSGLKFSNAVTIGSRRQAARPVVSTWSSPSGSLPSSPRSYADGEGYNSADEQGPCFTSQYNDVERERLFEIEIRRVKGFDVKKMVEDGNCLFRAVADQVYGDPEAYDLARQMCIDYMERERDHFSQFITEGFTSYCKRKRRDKVYGNNLEIQAFSEMYNRPIHIYCYSTEPINIFHGSYGTDTPPIRLSYHHGNHYNSLVDPRRLTIGAGLGFSCLREANVDKDRVKAAIKAQQDQQIDNALLAEGRFYSDVELTEKEIERMVMEASRAEYLGQDKSRQLPSSRETSTSRAEPSSSTTRNAHPGNKREKAPVESGPSSTVEIVLSMGFSYMQVIEGYSIFGDDVDSLLCYLLEMGGAVSSPPGGSNRLKGKAAE